MYDQNHVLIAEAIRYLFGSWKVMQERKREAGLIRPSVGWLLATHRQTVEAAKRWNELKAYKDRYEQWFVEHPGDYSPPDELSEPLRKFKTEYEIYGL